MMMVFFVLFIVFRFTCDIVDEYIAESIVYITKWMKLSEGLAGVTLLALANGAGDLVTAVVASGSDEGVSYNIGSLFGAGLFVCTVVIAATINENGKPLVYEKHTIYRDLVFYIAGILLVIVCGIMAKLTVLTSCLMLILYLSLVVVVAV